MVLYQLRKFSRSYKEVEQTIPKVYFIDNGFLLIQAIKDMGRFMESVVFVELVRKGLKPNKNLFYYKSNGYEVDFVIRKEKTKSIQVTYASGKEEIENREIKSLIKASEELKCKDLLIITWDYEDEITINNKKIRCLPLWKWLLSP